MCGVEDRVDLIVSVYRVLFMFCGRFWVEFGVLIHSFRSFASRLICLRPALDIGGLGCLMVVVFDLGVCMGQICVAMLWYSWSIVLTCAAA